MPNIILLCELTIVIPWLPCLCRMAKAVSSTVELVNSVTSDSVNVVNIAMCAFATKCSPIELVPCSDGWQRTWWHTMHMMPGLPVSSIPQCKSNRHQGACLELYLAIGRFKLTFREAHHTSKMICKLRSLKSWIRTRSFLHEIITSSNEVFKDFESNMAEGMRKLGYPTWQTAENTNIAKQTTGS